MQVRKLGQLLTGLYEQMHPEVRLGMLLHDCKLALLEILIVFQNGSYCTL